MPQLSEALELVVAIVPLLGTKAHHQRSDHGGIDADDRCDNHKQDIHVISTNHPWRSDVSRNQEA